MGGIVVDGLRFHGANDAYVIGDRANLRKDLGDLLAVLAEFLELMLWTEAVELLPLQLRDWLPLGKGFGHRLPMHLGELGSIIKCLQMRWTARHVEIDDAL